MRINLLREVPCFVVRAPMAPRQRRPVAVKLGRYRDEGAAVVRIAAPREARPARRKERLQADTSTARVLASGIDTLELWTAAPLTPAGRRLVEDAQRAAVESKEAVPLVVGPLELRASPRWRNTALLESDLYAVKVEPGAESTGATVRVEVRALALWAQGWEAAADRAVEVMAALCGDGEGLDVQVGRVDVCVDWQGWTPTPEERTRFVCRARRRARYFEDGHLQLDDAEWCKSESARVLEVAKRLAKASGPERRELLELIHKRPLPHREAEHDSGRHFTGLVFGLGAPLSSRLYDKTREIISSRKGWFRRVWGVRYDDAAPVWRLEFQVRREALRSFRFDAQGYSEDLSAWADLRPRLPALWRYLTRSWLRFGTRTADSRQVLSRAWVALADGWAGDAGQVEGLHRLQLEGAAGPVTAAVAGYLTTAAAQLAELGHPDAGDFGRTIAAVLRAAWDYTERKKGAPEAVAQRKRAPLAARRAMLDAQREARHAQAFALRARPRGHVQRALGVHSFHGVTVKRTPLDDVREAQAATEAALDSLAQLRRASDADDWKWCVAELA